MRELAGVGPSELPQLEEFFSALTWIPADEPITRAAGALARRHRAADSGIDDIDYVIAATALLLEAELLTTNVRRYPMLPNLEVAV